jgi:hypothetical protein
MPLFNFLHVSDLHIGAYPGRIGFFDLWQTAGLKKTARAAFTLSPDQSKVAKVSSYDAAILDGLAELAWEYRDEIDGVIITGDIATIGRKKDLQAASGFVYDLPGTLIPHRTVVGRPTLGGHSRVLLIPGNHDRFRRPFCYPGGRKFDRFFGHSWPVGQWAHSFGTFSKGGAEVIFLGADLTLRLTDFQQLAPPAVWGAGRAYNDVVQDLAALTSAARQYHPKAVVAWLIHFPPYFPNQVSALALIDEDKLDGAAPKEIVLLAGHTHLEENYDLPKSGAKVLCAGSATQFREPPDEERLAHFVTFDVLGSGDYTVAVKTLKWDDAQAGWVDKPPPHPAGLP